MAAALVLLTLGSYMWLGYEEPDFSDLPPQEGDDGILAFDDEEDDDEMLFEEDGDFGELGTELRSRRSTARTNRAARRKQKRAINAGISTV